MDADRFIKTIQEMTDKFYASDDSLRYQFHIGALETKLREVAFIANQQADFISELELKLLRGNEE